MLKQGEELEIFMAYVIGQGTDALNSITVVKNSSNNTQEFYYNNFDAVCIVSATEELIGNQPKEYLLHQNYPNPFNPSTIISWQVPVGSQQTLKICDVLGNEVATLVDEYKPAGTYELTWYAEGLPNGVYFYRLQAGSPSTGSGQSFVETKKMVLMK
jgi:hypothetical protein